MVLSMSPVWNRSFTPLEFCPFMMLFSLWGDLRYIFCVTVSSTVSGNISLPLYWHFSTWSLSHGIFFSFGVSSFSGVMSFMARVIFWYLLYW